MGIIDDAEAVVPHVTVGDTTLHKKLVSRLIVLVVLSLALVGAIALDLMSHRVDAGPAFETWLLGFVLGATIFGRIRRVAWDERSAMITVTKMDTLGLLLLVLYYTLDLAVEPFLSHHYHDAAIVKGLLFAFVFGTIAGRLLNFSLAIWHTRHS